MMPDQSLRLFIALELPPALRQQLERQQGALRSTPDPVRWVAPELLHLTLQFLGSVKAARVPALLEALEVAAGQARRFWLLLDGLGVFPSIRRPRVIWAGLSGQLEQLAELQRAVSGAMAALDLRQDKPFKPHLTLGRLRDGASREQLARLSRALAGQTLRGTERWQVDSLVLMLSELRPAGPTYTPLGHITLQ